MENRKRLRTRLLRNAVVAAIIVTAAWSTLVWQHSTEIQDHEIKSPAPAPPGYIGAERCGGCHAQATAAWRRSHHAQAMQEANASTVLGNFREAQFAKDQIVSSFYQKLDKYHVRTDGPDGRLVDYRIAYTFGVFPLQQYLVPFPKCRTPIRCTGREETRRGTTCVRSVTRPTYARITIWRKIRTRPPGRRSTSRVNPAMDLVRTTWPGRNRGKRTPLRWATARRA